MNNLNESINNGILKYTDKKRIRIEIEIPEEFVGDLKSDRFEDFFQRALADMNGDGCGGNYEQETAKMFIYAFKNGIISEVENGN